LPLAPPPPVPPHPSPTPPPPHSFPTRRSSDLFAYALHRTATGQTSSGADDYEVDKPRSSPGNAQNITESMRQIFAARPGEVVLRSEEHTSELQSRSDLVCRLLLEKKKKRTGEN